MKIILVQDVDTLGVQGDTVVVKDGYARNFLIPRGFAWPATPGNLKRLEQERKIWDLKSIREKAKAEDLKKKLEALTITIAARVGEENLLYGSVTQQQIADALEQKGILIDKRRIQLEEPIKRAGAHEVTLKLHKEVEAVLKVEVVGETGAQA
jgi:large subunit ribosomal protein L9